MATPELTVSILERMRDHAKAANNQPCNIGGIECIPIEEDEEILFVAIRKETGDLWLVREDLSFINYRKHS